MQNISWNIKVTVTPNPGIIIKKPKIHVRPFEKIDTEIMCIILFLETLIRLIPIKIRTKTITFANMIAPIGISTDITYQSDK